MNATSAAQIEASRPRPGHSFGLIRRGIITASATWDDRPATAFWPMLFADVTIRLLGSDDFPAAKREAAQQLTTAACEGALPIPIGDPPPLSRIAEAHDRVDAGACERVLLSIP